jgi:hypothetical protein
LIFSQNIEKSGEWHFNPELQKKFNEAVNRELTAALDTQEKQAAREDAVKEVLAIDWGAMNPFRREDPEVKFEDRATMGGEEGRTVAQIQQLLRNPETHDAVMEQLQRIVGRQGQSWLGSTVRGLGRAVDEARKIPGEVAQWGQQTWDKGVAAAGQWVLQKIDQIEDYYNTQKGAVEAEAARLAQEYNTTKEQAAQAIANAFDASVRGTGAALEGALSLGDVVEQAKQNLRQKAQQMQQRGREETPEIWTPGQGAGGIGEQLWTPGNSNFDNYAKSYIGNMIKMADNFDKMAKKEPAYYHFADTIDKALIEMM